MAAALGALLLAAAVALLASGAAAAEAGRTAAAEAANAVLRAHQLPGGLLPAGITAFRHDAATGAFEADLAAPCTTRFEVELRYNGTVAGVISRGRIAAISGVAMLTRTAAGRRRRHGAAPSRCVSWRHHATPCDCEYIGRRRRHGAAPSRCVSWRRHATPCDSPLGSRTGRAASQWMWHGTSTSFASSSCVKWIRRRR